MASTKESNKDSSLADLYELPCGMTLKNRIVKAAMAEALANPLNGLPNELHLMLYAQWAIGQYGLMITGNVQVDSSYIGLPGDIFCSKKNSTSPAWSAWARACRINKTPCLVQLNHPGRQSLRGLIRVPWKSSLAPSSIPLKSGTTWLSKLLMRLLFGTPKALSKQEMDTIVGQFVSAAFVMFKAGFDGVQIHCSHGYLLAQMMSPKTNLRTDEYGKNRLKLLFDIIDSIRAICPATFCVAVKINASDYVQGGLTVRVTTRSLSGKPIFVLKEDGAFQQVQQIVAHGGVDIIEISGGTYQSPAFAQEQLHNARKAFFTKFSTRCKTYLSCMKVDNHSGLPAILLTGGFRDRSMMRQALQDEATDLVGIARATCVDPFLPKRLLDDTLSDNQASCVTYRVRGISLLQRLAPIKVVGAGFNTGWHCFQLARIGRGRMPNLKASFLGLLWVDIVPSEVKMTMIGGVLICIYYWLRP